MSTDCLLTMEDLVKRWRIKGPNAKAIRKTLYRRMEEWGLHPMAGTRGPHAVFRPSDVLKAEERAAA